jgi:biopolymer transport protein ExbD
MGKFKQKKKNTNYQLNTASLPDIVFMLLFFFMVTTTLRETELFIQVKMPEATEIKKLEKKSLVSSIYIGQPRPNFQKMYGTEPRIQLNDQFSRVSDISDFIEKERADRNEKEVPLMTAALKVDGKTKMGIVTDVKQELRKCNALKINYTARKKAI